ncbi:GNAT family N-acetyltransferase [Halovenus rubra]|uniref:GNAT family N-acetyltransferase n=2 Tax=Halovenus rubra TaxID=869890 RepID=A0ACC7E532_9EURY|nr:GNAT family protein [Halovenus rubra]
MPGAIVKCGDSVTLRVFEREDFPVWQRGGANPELRHLTGNPKARNRDQLESVFESEDVEQFLICTNDDGKQSPVDGQKVRQIGIAVLKEWGRTPFLGLWLFPEVHGNGYGKEAASLLVEYTFKSYDTPAVRANAFDHNQQSRGLLETLGFTQEGRLRKDAFIDGEYRDGVVYGLLREEWNKA